MKPTRNATVISDVPILDKETVHRFFENSKGKDHFPPVMSPRQAAALLNVSVHTVYKWLSHGYLRKCSRKRGKHVFLWRDALVAELFGGPNWKGASDETP